MARTPSEARLIHSWQFIFNQIIHTILLLSLASDLDCCQFDIKSALQSIISLQVFQNCSQQCQQESGRKKWKSSCEFYAHTPVKYPVYRRSGSQLGAEPVSNVGCISIWSSHQPATVSSYVSTLTDLLGNVGYMVPFHGITALTPSKKLK